MTSERRLNILVVFPDVEPMWRPGETMMRERLADHDLAFVSGLADAEPHLGEAEVMLSFTFRDDFAPKAPRLRWIQGFGAGVESFANLPALRPDIVLTNMRGIHGPTVAEHALAMMFALSRHIPRSVRDQAAHRWAPFQSTLLHGKTLGVLGVGAIAEALAQRCQALGMRTVGVSGGRGEAPGFDEIRPRDDMAAAVRDFDYLVLLAPVTPQNRGVVNRDLLGALKPGCRLVNVARGALVNEPDLIEALTSDQVAGAALDTFVQEPLPSEHPFWDMPNVLVTPHNAGRHDGYVADALDIFQFNIERYLAGDFAGMRNLLK